MANAGYIIRLTPPAKAGGNGYNNFYNQQGVLKCGIKRFVGEMLPILPVLKVALFFSVKAIKFIHLITIEN